MSTSAELRETLSRRVGARLRARRTDLGRTLADVAGEAEISVSYLSAVEGGVNLPSLPTLARIVHALGLSIADVLSGEGHNRVRADRLELDHAGVRSISHEELQLDVAFLVCLAGDAGESPVALAGRDLFVHVRSGALTVEVDGREYALGPGDALDAVAPAQLRWRCGEPATTTSTWAAGPPQSLTASD